MDNQLYLPLKDTTEERQNSLEREMLKLKEQMDKVRKSLYAQLAKVNKVDSTIISDLEMIKKNICKTSKSNDLNLF